MYVMPRAKREMVREDFAVALGLEKWLRCMQTSLAAGAHKEMTASAKKI